MPVKNRPTKDEIRETIKERLRRVDRAGESAMLLARLKPLIPSSGGVLAYDPLPSEVDIGPLIEELREAGRLVLVGGSPTEPVLDPPEIRVTAAIVPGRAFDRQGNRLGRGGGTFDRVLSTLGCRKIGVCFACQLVDELPVEEHDIRMDLLVTPRERIAC